ncbi:hypothetical protein CRE_14472 [Caenorhabditis remanei]|uniref:Uncharacterized protein n=1 Tax=Caenorhabditis remanei TaxID=31234 RepID=E3M938_CAERE|nr:hypothetical protein CRE_14472 [Caenorhabditis remanei]
MSSTWSGRGLPCRKIFKLSTIVTAVEASKWTSSRFYDDSKNLFRFVFKAVSLDNGLHLNNIYPFQIAKRDVFFAGYSAQDSSNVGFVPYGDRFYKPIVDFVVAGFRQPRDVNTLTSLHCAARESMTNLLDRFRKEYKEKMETTAKEVAGSLKDHLFPWLRTVRIMNFWTSPTPLRLMLSSPA